MSNGGNGGGPRPPEVDEVEISNIEGGEIIFSGSKDGEPIEIVRRGTTEYFAESKVGDKFEIVFRPK